MILVVGGIKGGCGKTTLATNLTVIRASKGKKVLLVDADEQNSASDWANQREDSNIKTEWTTIRLSGNKIYSQIRRLKDDYDEIIVDVGGRDTTHQRSALCEADKFLVPFRPRTFDVWTLGKLLNLIQEIKSNNHALKSYAVINQADSRGQDNDEAIKHLSQFEEIKCLDISIGSRKVFANAACEGLGITELKKKDQVAINELLALHDFMYSECT